jgi:serine/threonine protein phosphatase PrpC
LFRYNNENNEITPGVWLSLYEGYGEEWITKYLSKKMHLVFKENLKKLPYDYLASLESTFHTANQAVLDILKRKHLQFAAEALCCWLQEDVVYVANCGGSKAIMISPSANEWLELHSKRHSVHDFTEKERIVKAGGRVSNGLINGLWTSSRFLGSSQPGKITMLLNYNRSLHFFTIILGIICAPDLAQKTISKDNVCIILLTSKEISIRLSTQKLVRQIARAYCLNEQCNANFIVSQIMQLVDTTRVKNFYNAGVIVAIIRPKSIVFL